MRLRITVFLLCLCLFISFIVFTEKERTNRLNICKEYLLQCGKLGYSCSCP